ncbi:hypothetical protein T35B1_02754 [Salinisphaera shabanensis T35B1]|uniref:DUF3072 domain-containing protein n=1 Tax=Salinisphaera shabanensis E1L3A TaxID=1033802 RepID=U2FPW0_9GAMM|nr:MULTISPECIES: DUF3072 domain-containing protein [Salinisphaera]ERJ18184.1 hypothetical protein SSPSH_002961 [Salinisphaera shabanensis E1L3A]MAS10926.1 DUF3072 domain-containing protein [Salinisphaera sp.]
MSDSNKTATEQEQPQHSNIDKDPENWTTGDEAMTGAQKSYLQTLCEEANETFDPNLSKAQASQRIDELQSIANRGA